MFIKIYRVRYRTGTEPLKLCSALVFGTKKSLFSFLGGYGSCGKEGEGAEDSVGGTLHLLTGALDAPILTPFLGKSFSKNIIIVSLL